MGLTVECKRSHTAVTWNYRSEEQNFEHCKTEESKPLKHGAVCTRSLSNALSYVEGEPVVHVFMILTFKNIF